MEEPTLEDRLQPLIEAVNEMAIAVIAGFRPLVELMEGASKTFLWQLHRAFNPPQPKWPPLRNKRAWQHSQKERAQIKRRRRARKRADAALALRYQART